MPTYQSETGSDAEPKSRFYPPQGLRPSPVLSMPAHPTVLHDTLTTPDADSVRTHRSSSFRSYKKEDDVVYFTHRHPIFLQRLYEAADTFLTAYPHHSFIYDAYPDALSLQLMRDRLLRENRSITEDFLQAGCPIAWLNVLTDTVLWELLLRFRKAYRNPRGEASTTSVRSFFES